MVPVTQRFIYLSLYTEVTNGLLFPGCNNNYDNYFYNYNCNNEDDDDGDNNYAFIVYSASM